MLKTQKCEKCENAKNAKNGKMRNSTFSPGKKLGILLFPLGKSCLIDLSSIVPLLGFLDYTYTYIYIYDR